MYALGVAQYIIQHILHKPGHTGIRQVFIFAHDRVVEYCVSQNATRTTGFVAEQFMLKLVH